MTKIHPASLLHDEDQIRLYQENRGILAAERQVKAAALQTGKCVCTPVKVKHRWQNSDKPTVRTVHQTGCPKRKLWMEEWKTPVR